MQSHEVSLGIHVPPIVVEFVFRTTKNVIDDNIPFVTRASWLDGQRVVDK